jgi:hypothetical protein
MAVLSVGVIGVFSMEKVTIASNAHAKNLAIATHIAQAWLGVLEAESTLWDATPLSLNRTVWLQTIANQPTWLRPKFDDGLKFGGEFDELGNAVEDDGKFCADLRLTRLTGANEEADGSGVWRAEVRVYWMRDNPVLTATLATTASPCDLLPVKVSLQPESSLLHFVYLSGAVRQVVP